MDLVFPDWLCSKFNSFRTRQDSAIFRKEATQVLATHESSLARAITIEETYKRLRKLSVKQDDLVRQALRCTEHKLFRAAYVLAWARPMDFLKEKLALDMPKLNSARPNWKVKTIEDLRDVGSDYQILEALRDLSLCTKVEEKALKGS